jgi:hypothetical protein
MAGTTLRIPEITETQARALLRFSRDGLQALRETLGDPRELVHYSREDIAAMRAEFEEGERAVDRLASAIRWEF